MDRLMIIVKSGPEGEARVKEALRLMAALIGMDYPTILVFTDRGVDCLKPGAFDDPDVWDYLQAASDLSEIFVLGSQEKALDTEHLNQDLVLNPISIDEMTELVKTCGSVAAF
jgi:sulfur relay (sulfurtransferase) DsrF/TusC family protein